MRLILNLHHLQMNQKQSRISIHLSYLSLKNSDAISEQIEAVNAVLSTPPVTENKVSDGCRGLCNIPGEQLDTMKKANMLLDFNEIVSYWKRYENHVNNFGFVSI